MRGGSVVGGVGSARLGRVLVALVAMIGGVVVGWVPGASAAPPGAASPAADDAVPGALVRRPALPSGTPLPIPDGVTDMAVDDANQRVFLASEPADAVIVVRFDGSTETVIPGLPGARHLTIAGDRVFVALDEGAQLRAISRSTLAVSDPLVTGVAGARPMAVTAGGLWFTTGCVGMWPGEPGPNGELIRFDLAAGSVSRWPLSALAVPACTHLTSTPTRPGQLVGSFDMRANFQAFVVLDVSSGSPTVVVRRDFVDFIDDLKFSPDGDRFLTMSSAWRGVRSYDPTTTDADGVVYAGPPATGQGHAFDVTGARGGLVAGTADQGNTLWVRTLTQPSAMTIEFDVGDVSWGSGPKMVNERAVRFRGDGTALFTVVTDWVDGEPLTSFHVVPVAASPAPFDAPTDPGVDLGVDSFGDIVVDPVRDQVYVSSPGDDLVVVLRRDGSYRGVVPGLPGARAMTMHGDRLLVALTTAAAVAEVDTTTLTVVGWPITGAPYPVDVAVVGGTPTVLAGCDGQFGWADQIVRLGPGGLSRLALADPLGACGELTPKPGTTEALLHRLDGANWTTVLADFATPQPTVVDVFMATENPWLTARPDRGAFHPDGSGYFLPMQGETAVVDPDFGDTGVRYRSGSSRPNGFAVSAAGRSGSGRTATATDAKVYVHALDEPDGVPLIFGMRTDVDAIAFDPTGDVLLAVTSNAHPSVLHFRFTATNLAAAPPRGPGRFHAVGPSRLFDSRNHVFRGSPLAPASVETFSVSSAYYGPTAPPAGVSAVAVTVTVTDPTESTFLTLYPNGTERPATSTINVLPGETRASTTVMSVGIDQRIAVYNHAGNAHVVVDITGWFDDGSSVAPGGGSGFTAVAPARVLDTRDDGGPIPENDGHVRTVDVTGVPGTGVPASGVAAVALNVTAIDPTVATHLTVYPTGGAVPWVSSVNAPARSVVPNLVIVPVGPDGNVRIRNNSGAAHVAVDVLGWFSMSPSGRPLTSSAPTRLCDTRSGQGCRSGKVGPNGIVIVDPAPAVAGLAAGDAVVVNVTAVDPSVATYLTVFPSATSAPLASNLNPSPGRATANHAVARVGADGRIAVRNHTGATDVVVDLVGVLRA